MLSHPLLQIIIAPPLAALAIMLFRQKLGRKVNWFARGSLIYSTLLLLGGCIHVSSSAPLLESYPFAGPAITFNLLGDGISLPVALIINLLCMALSFYADHYIEHRIEAWAYVFPPTWWPCTFFLKSCPCRFTSSWRSSVTSTG